MNKQFNWALYIGPVVSIISIFIANWLGRITAKQDYKLQTKEKSYLNFYVPLMKFLSSANKNSMTYYFLIAIWYGAPKPIRKEDDFLNHLLKNNLELLPPDIVNLVPEYNVATGGSKLFFGEDQYHDNYRENLINSSELFDKIITLSLKEASIISKALGYQI